MVSAKYYHHNCLLFTVYLTWTSISPCPFSFIHLLHYHSFLSSLLPPLGQCVEDARVRVSARRHCAHPRELRLLQRPSPSTDGHRSSNVDHKTYVVCGQDIRVFFFFSFFLPFFSSAYLHMFVFRTFLVHFHFIFDLGFLTCRFFVHIFYSQNSFVHVNSCRGFLWQMEISIKSQQLWERQLVCNTQTTALPALERYSHCAWNRFNKIYGQTLIGYPWQRTQLPWQNVLEYTKYSLMNCHCKRHHALVTS